MGVIVTFDYDAWVKLYPEFAYLNSEQVESYFNLATTIHRNDGGGPVTLAATQTSLLYILTAHVAKLFAPGPSGQAASPLVGRISQAAEGSVNLTIDLPTNMSAASAWFTQTSYGLMYWTATAPFRIGRYIANPRSPVNAGIWGVGWARGGSWA